MVGLVDVFFTVLLYEAFGFISSRVHRGVWHLVRGATHGLSEGVRGFIRSMAAPAMVPITLLVWLGSQLAGFALIFRPGLDDGSFALADEVEPSLGVAFYMSGMTLSTLGYGDVTPQTVSYQLATTTEALVGLGILTLTISYILGVYGVQSQLAALSARLRHQTQDRGHPRTLLIAHFPDGEPVDLGLHLRELHLGIIELYEGIRRYPIVYYFHSRHAYRSISFVFRCIGDMVATLRWGLPRSHPVTRDPWLAPLMAGFEHVRVGIERSLLRRELDEHVEPVSFEQFRSRLLAGERPVDEDRGRGDRDRDQELADEAVDAFLGAQAFMAELTRSPGWLDEREAYERYCRWLPFVARSGAFVEAVAEDLGYEQDRILDDVIDAPAHHATDPT